MNREFRYWLAATEEFPERRNEMPFTFQVRGCSMLPLIRPGVDEVTMVRWLGEISELNLGDIVFFECEEVSLRYVLHRLIKKDGSRILTMGDGNLYDDGWTDVDKVIGRVVKIRRGGFSFDPNGMFGKLYFMLWRRLLPVRRQALEAIHFCGRIKRRVKGR